VNKIKTLNFFSVIIFMIALHCSCANQNHIDEYKVNIDSLKTLPDNLYAYRRGSIFIEDVNTGNYRTWFTINAGGNVGHIYKIDDFKNQGSDAATTIKRYSIDTFNSKSLAQEFIRLSTKYKFGHIYIDKSNLIYFSHKDGVTQQYVRALNDSIQAAYLNNTDFRLLHNGWFEYIER